MRHSEDKMKSQIQHAIVHLTDPTITQEQRRNAYVAVQNSMASSIAEIAKLPVNDAWYMYYCKGLSINAIAKYLNVDTHSVQLLMRVTIGKLADMFLEAETC